MKFEIIIRIKIDSKNNRNNLGHNISQHGSTVEAINTKNPHLMKNSNTARES